MTDGRWGQVLKLASLSPSESALLAVCVVEEKTHIIFLRVPDHLALPELMWDKLAAASRQLNSTLKRTERWPTVDDLQEVVGDLRWLWGGWIPKGFLSMLVGMPGVGKTTIGHHFIKVVVTGGTWPDGTSQTQQPAVIVETEAAQVLLVKHFRDMQIPMGSVYMPGFDGDVLGQPDLGKKKHQERLRQLCEAVRPGLVVVDSIGAAHTKGENQVEQMRPLLEFLATLARDYFCSVLAIHHFRKRGEGSENEDLTVDMVRGSSVITAFTRSLLGLSKQKGVLQLEVIKSNVAPIGPPLAVRFEKDEKGDVVGVSFAGIQPAQAQAQPTAVDLCAEWLWDTLNTEGKQSVKTLTEWADGEGHKRSTLFRAMHQLEASGELVRTGRGKDTKWELFRVGNPKPLVPAEPEHAEPLES